MLAGVSFAAPGDGLDGANGHIFKVDAEGKHFELLKETEYDPKTDIGKSRFTVHWSDATVVTRLEELKNFAGITEPVAAAFYGIDKPNQQALEAGEAFEARVAVLHSGSDLQAAGKSLEGKQGVVGWFAPSDGEKPRGGVIEIKGKAVPVSLRQRFSRIYHHQPLKSADLATGFWKATLQGSEEDGKFVVASMEVEPLPDPRKTDDPKLPRVLVIGDSISMNYHDAAKEALEGVANYHRNEGNAFSSAHGVANSELWLGDYKEPGFQWDVIQFNHGLHDLKQTYDKATDTFGEYAVPLDDYKANLEKQIAILEKTGAKLIWCATTPVPNDNKSQYARRKGASAEFNAAALEVMKRHPEILINDLYGLIGGSPVFDGWRKQNDVHFYKAEEKKVLGDAVAGAVKRALGKSG
ncbi:lipolytic protein G-D-S-L family [Haloferula helveola]|uniref:Lipolytic protein G-D-S-L family n=2 Tax=Haloferula helveola TaxID=490095 RepID=A0ABM7RGY1_9BACT|nr:lipolytic protein G-D-S-L family [Haloferula helveola]